MPVRTILLVLLACLAAAGCETGTRCNMCDCLEYQPGQRKVGDQWVLTSRCDRFMCQHGRNQHKSPADEPPPVKQTEEAFAAEEASTETN